MYHFDQIAPENIPDFLNGKCKCAKGCLNEEAGEWMEELKFPGENAPIDVEIPTPEVYTKY